MTIIDGRRRIGRAAAFALTGLLVLGLGYQHVRSPDTVEVPPGAQPGTLTVSPCEYETEAGDVAADCGTLIVPENRRNPASALIALPVVRVRATGPDPAEPIFRLTGGPGATNMTFPQASRLTERHDLVLVGYRGVDGSRRLDCKEVTEDLGESGDLSGAEAQRQAAESFRNCAFRFAKAGVDVTGYSIPQRVDDLEAVRTALGYSTINLLSSSAGTRTAMVYSWRYPQSLHRSAMLSVNPPGHFVWDPAITDRQFAQYASLCAADTRCAGRTGDLAATMRETAADIPQRWGPLQIKGGNVRIAGMYGMFHNGASSGPVNAGTIIDAYLSAAEGDASGLWALSTVGDLLLPSSIVWGEFASFGMIDAPAAERYYAGGGDPGSILGNAAADFLWGGPSGYFRDWPDSPDNAEYRTIRPSDVETLLVSGAVDFSTPPELATLELLPSLTRGRQVILSGLGHTNDFWEHQPDAGAHLLAGFFDEGTADDSQFEDRPVAFTPAPLSMSVIGKLVLGIAAGGALLTVLLLGALALRVRTRGGLRPRTGATLRILTPVPLGLGGWMLAALLAWTLWPETSVIGWGLVVPSVALAVGLGAWLCWVRPGRPRRAAAVALGAGALLGALLGQGAVNGIGAPFTAAIGAAAVANLALLLLDARPAATPVP